jgi:hypothetical protein
MLHEPLAYAGAILRGLTFYVSPRPGEGDTPASIREALEENKEQSAIEPAIALLYPHSIGYYRRPGAVAALAWYESHTRVQGTLMVVLLLAALAGPFLLRGRTRAAAILFGLTALASATFAVAGAGYDARYAYVAFGPLAASSALGAWALWSAARVKRAAQRSRLSPRMLKRKEEKKI